MKKPVLTIATLLMASSFANAATSSQSANDLSGQSLESIIKAVASTSNASVKISTSAGDSLQDAREAIAKEMTQQMRKGGVVHTAAGSMSAVGAFSVAAVETVVKGTTLVTDYVFKGVQSGSIVSLEVTEKYVARPIAKGVDSAAQGTYDGAKYVGGKVVDGGKYAARKTWNVGTGVVLGISTSGLVLIEEMGKAETQSSQGHSLTSAAILLGSVSVSAQALGSKVVEGYEKP